MVNWPKDETDLLKVHAMMAPEEHSAVTKELIENNLKEAKKRRDAAQKDVETFERILGINSATP